MTIMPMAQISQHEGITEIPLSKTLKRYSDDVFSEFLTVTVTENRPYLVETSTPSKAKVAVQPTSIEVKPEIQIAPLVKTVLEHNSSIAVIILLIWLIKTLTHFVEVCRK